MSRSKKKNIKKKFYFKKEWIFPGFLVLFIIAFLLTLGIYNAEHPTVSAFGSGTAPATPPPASPLPAHFQYQGLPMLGKPNAPVKVVEMADFKCPICKMFHDDIFPTFKKLYIDTGKVDLYFSDFETIPNSENAFEAGQSIAHQSNAAFWAYYNTMYTYQGNEDTNWATPARILQLIRAHVPGVNLQMVANAMKKQTYQKEFQSEMSVGEQVNIPGTPSVFVNGQYVVDVFNEKAFFAQINQQINQKNKHQKK